MKRRALARTCTRAALRASLLGSIAIAIALAPACARPPRTVRPVAHVASSIEAQAAFGPLREAWNDPNRMPRDELKAGLEAFLAKFGTDGLAPLARVYLAFVWLERGDDARAAATLEPLEGLRPGTTHDIATVARARILRRGGHPERAFELLRPLVGKLVDAEGRSVFGEEITLAAVESRREYEAVAYMDAWLRATPEDERDIVRAKVRRALDEMPPAVLIDTLRAMRGQRERGGYSLETQRLITARLAAVALERGDSELARWLVANDAASGALGGGPGDEALGELATTRRGLRRVSGRAIGLLLPTRDLRMQEESAEVIRGMAWALELPRRDTSDRNDERLVTRDASSEAGALDARLDELASEGVAAIVTGLDSASADAALRWAEARRVPVLTLTVPRTVSPGRFGFVLGQSLESELTLLATALVARRSSGAAGSAPAVTKVAPVIEIERPEGAVVPLAMGPLTIASPGVCERNTEHAAASPFPNIEWQKERVKAWVVAAPLECARKLLRFATAAMRGGTIAFTLEASPAIDPADGARLPTGIRLVAASAGVVPALTPASSASSASSPPPADRDVAAFAATVGRRPDWWTALGRDAGVIARRAIANLPVDDTLEEAEVARRREAARAGVEAARAPLWTSEAEGVDRDAHVLRRALRLVEVTSGSTAAPRRVEPAHTP